MSFFGEMKRRNVFRVGVAYLIAAWLLLQIVDVVSPMLALPEWLGPTVLILLAVGFVVAVFVAWAYEITPEGIKRERDVDRSESITHLTGRKLDFAIIGVLVVALGFFALDRFVWQVEEVDLDKSIAVLPFENRSADESDVYFVDGIHDDILTQLHRLSDIEKVISRTSVERYQGSDMSTPEIAAELGVATILEGGVQRAGDRIRITVQLIDAVNDKHLWAENFERELTTANVFEIQTEISMAIAESLRIVLTDDEASDLQKLPTENLEAWEQYQRGRYELRDRTLDGIARAIDRFEEATQIDDGFALAHVGLADAHNLFVVWSFEVGGGLTVQEVYENLEKATAAAESALNIDDRLGEAYAALGYSHQFYSGYPEFGAQSVLLADEYYRRARQLAPNYADLYRWHSQVLYLRPISNPVEALSMAQHAVALDPMLAVNHGNLGNSLDVNGRFEEALESYAESIKLAPTILLYQGYGVGTLQNHNEYVRAVVLGRELIAQNKASPEVSYYLALSYRTLGDLENANYWIDRTLESDAVYVMPHAKSIVALDAGDVESAIEHLFEALEIWIDDWDAIHDISYLLTLNRRPDELLEFIEQHAPPMLDQSDPLIWPQAVRLVAPAAWALRETGDPKTAEILLASGLEVARKGVRQADMGYGTEIADIEIYVLQGNHRQALEALTKAIEDGYRNPEWLEVSHFLDPIRSEPEFLAAMDVIRADVARQRAELEEMERNGELPPLPQ